MKKTNAKQNNKGGNAKQQEPTKNAKEIKKGTTETKASTTNDTSGLGKDKPATKNTSSIKTHPAQTIKKLSIYEKLFNAQQTAGVVLKTGRNEHHKYDYSKESDIIGEAKPILGEQRLTYIYTVLGAKLQESDIKKRELTIRFTLINIDNPTETIVTDIKSEGENKEGSTVGYPVAYTMALKYYLAKLLMLETGNDAEVQIIELKKKAKKEAKGEKIKQNPTEEYEKAMRLVKSSRNVQGLMEYSEKVKTGKFYTDEQKESLLKAISNRVDELDNG